MPNRDGGHYFLTVLAPIRVDLVRGDIAGRSYSHRQSLAQKLALLPTGRQTAASPPDAWPSPFSRNTLNHLCRLVIIDGPNFNGRLSGDTLLNIKTNPLIAQPVDALTTPYLLFAADFDAQGPGDALSAYAAALWSTMRADLEQIFGHCVGFESVTDAAGFEAYLRRCQVETTMPFNDYWADDNLSKANDRLTFGWIKPALGVLAAALIVLAWALHGFGWAAALAAAVLAGILAIGAAVWGLYLWIMKHGPDPFPTASPDADLPSILKALFVQQAFTRFAIQAQALDDQALHARFGAFLAAVAPDQTTPAQVAGECHAPTVEWTT